MPEAVQEAAREVRTNIFAELREYYRKQGIEQYAVRLGRLMTVTHAVQVIRVFLQSF